MPTEKSARSDQRVPPLGEVVDGDHLWSTPKRQLRGHRRFHSSTKAEMAGASVELVSEAVHSSPPHLLVSGRQINTLS